MDLWQALHQITDLEYDKVEIWLDEQGALKPSYVISHQDEFIARLREETRLSPIALTLAHDVDLVTFEGLCRVSKILRITQIVIPSAPLGTPFNSEIDRLRELVNLASVSGIRVGLRTQGARLTGDAHTAVELCQAVDKLGLAFDPSYFLDERTADAILELATPFTTHVHLRDSTADKLQVQVGLGEVDYSRLISYLERRKYDRALSVEILPELIEPQQRQLELRKLRMLIESLL
jgi:sugar phosphate isomerase/epimerase